MRLVLDEDGNFNHLNPSDDTPAFLPGSYYGGASRPVLEVAGSDGQVARLIAFFADASNPNQWVPPPAGSLVTFTHEGTSAWRGYAMNAAWGDPRDDAPDYRLSEFDVNGSPMQAEGATSTVSFGEQPYAVVALRIRDYGGKTTARAQSGAIQATPLKLPRDNENNGNGNWVPDAGWKAPFTSPTTTVEVSVTDDGASAWTDLDEGVTPIAAAPDGPPAVGLQGDGLTRFEEYRGFVVTGIHTRTSPIHKDLFVATRVSRQQSLNLDEGLRFAKASLFEHGVRLHRIRDFEDEPGSGESLGPLLNYSYLHGGVDPTSETAVGPTFRRYVQGVLRVQSEASGGFLGATTGPCGATVGYTPNNPPLMRIDVQAHVTRGANPPLTTAQIDNEIRRTIGHELGHGIHVKHKVDPNEPNPAPQCDDMATTSGTSMMSSAWGNGVDMNNAASKYSDADVKQMRLHLNPQP